MAVGAEALPAALRVPPSTRHDAVMWRRSAPAEPAIYRDEVLDIIGARADTKAWTYEIRQLLKGTMKRRKWTPEERAALRAEAEASVKNLCDLEARGRAELAAKRRAEAEKPRGLKRLLPFEARQAQR